MRFMIAFVALCSPRPSAMRRAAVPVAPKPVLPRDNGKPHPFNVRDLVMMDRVSDPQLSPDGKQVAFQVRETDYAANKGVTSIWVLDLDDKSAQPTKLAKNYVASSPRWSPDGKYIYFLGKLAKGGNVDQILRLSGSAKSEDAPELIAPYSVDINNFKLSPDGKKIAMSIDVSPDCAAQLCTSKEADPASAKASGKLYDKLFVRHWDTWSDGKRSQLFIADVNADAAKKSMVPLPHWLTKGIDGDVPSKPFGDDGEYPFSPDGKTDVFRRAHRGQDRTVVDEFRHLRGACRWLRRAAQPDRSEQGVGQRAAGVRRRQDAVLPRDEAPDVRGGPLRHHGAGSGQRQDSRDRSAMGSLRGKSAHCPKMEKRCTRPPTTTAIIALFAVDIASGKATRLSAQGKSRDSAWPATKSSRHTAR